MTNKEATNILRQYIGLINTDDDRKAFEMAIKALEKQCEKQAIKSDKARWGMGYDYYDWVCPTCNSFLAYEPDKNAIPMYCQKCGQKLR